MSRYHRLVRAGTARTVLGSLFILVGGAGVAIGVYLLATALAVVFRRPDGADGVASFGELGDLAVAFLMVAAFLPGTLVAARWIQRRPVGTLSSVTGRLRWRWLLRLLPIAMGASALTLGVGSLVTGDVGGSFAGWGSFLTGAAVLVLVVPPQVAAEEYLTRGWLLQAVGSWCRKPWLPIAVQALVFAGLHGWGTPWGFADLTIFGAVAGWLTVRTGGLEAALALHLANNLISAGLAAAFGDLGVDETAADMPWQFFVVDLVVLTAYASLVLWSARRAGVAFESDAGRLDRGGDTSCATTGSIDYGFDLAGSGWKFSTGDDLAWAATSFDDSSWKSWTVPDNWNNEADLAKYAGYAWYRKTFTLPARPAGVTDSSIVAALGQIDDADQTFLNGTEIGKTGGFPPAFDSTWEVPRAYYPKDGLLNWGGTNTIAVRMYDGTGGGGFYAGPVGLYTKAHLRGIPGKAATKSQLAYACAILNKQHQAIAGGDVRSYAKTLADGFFHQGDTADRRLAEVKGWIAAKKKITLTDAQADVFVDNQGRIVVDTIRSWTAADGTELLPATRELLYLDPRKGVELGDHSRFFRDSYQSAAMSRRVQFDVYLPKSYTRTTARRFPVVYMLNGFNGSNIEWEARHMDTVLDQLVKDRGLEESIVIFPDGGSGWYVETSAGNYKTMIVKEVQPIKLVQSMTAAELNRHTYYFDGGDQDEYGFGAAARNMSVALASKGVKHDYQLGAGNHADSYWMPKLDRSFGLHSDQFRAHPVRQPREPKLVSTYVWP